MYCDDGHTRNCLQDNQWKGGDRRRRNTIATTTATTSRKVVVAVVVAAIEYVNGIHIIERTRGKSSAL